MPEPVFTADDRATPPASAQGGDDGLPAELKGKSPKEIAQYFANRERQIIQSAREAIRTNDPTRLPGNQNPGSVTMTRPTETPTGATPAELESARQTLAQVARTQAMQGKQYWGRFSTRIDEIMNTMDPSAKADYRVWETVYNSLVGENKAALDAEEREAAATAARQAAERASAPAPETVPPPPLPSKVTQSILPGLGISEDRYRKAQEQIAKGEWPLTWDSTQGRAS